MDDLGNWRQSAADYLEWWCLTDRRLVNEFSTEITCAKLADLFSPTRYKVARTVPGYGPEKYRSLAQTLNSLRQAAATEESVPKIIEEICYKMSKEYGKFIPSAISKAFWMMKGHPVAVYDRFARGGLRRVGFSFNGLYHPYFTAWLTFFNRSDTQERVFDATTWLPTSPVAGKLKFTKQISDGELRQLAVSPRFRNRVVDKWLMHKGSA